MNHIKTIERSTGNIINPIRGMFLDYFNNYLTIEKFAEHYNISVELAQKIIDEGREQQ